jgi:hypothetical protein
MYSIVLKRTETLYLSYIINASIKTLKKGLKRNYGKSDSIKYVDTLNSLKDLLNDKVYLLLKDDLEEQEIEFTKTEIEFFYSFLDFCKNQLKTSSKDLDMIVLLEEVQSKIMDEYKIEKGVVNA